MGAAVYTANVPHHTSVYTMMRGSDTPYDFARVPMHLMHGYVDGDTPLHVAASHHMAEAVTYLLAKGANPNALNNVR